MHARTSSPSSSTEHAPHCAIPQPRRGPVNFSSLRSTNSKGVSGAADTTCFARAKQVVSAAPETPLLFVLRNELKLTGPRLGCGMAQCGACSVLLDGEEVRACITPTSYAAGKQRT